MKLKLIVTILFLSSYCFSQDENFKYVTAFNGLVIRDQPSINGNKIGKISYRSRINVIQKTSKKFIFNENGYKIYGEWVQIDNSEVTNTPSYVFDGFLKSKEELQNSYELIEYKSDSTLNHFQGVYELNHGYYGILLESFFEKYSLEYDYTAIMKYHANNEDTEVKIDELLFNNPIGSFFSNQKITKNINHFKNKFWYVYYEKGVRKVNISDVIFRSDGCGEGLQGVLVFDNLYPELGEPILASEKKLSLSFKNYKKAEAQKNNYTNLNLWRDCSFDGDSQHVKVFAKYNDLYFGYRNQNDIDIREGEDPFRVIFKIKNDKIIHHYDNFLDLFGCSCE
ncbi:SH3 domain-containing protein [Tenacibaculum sp. M341]|uniref:SH3 domain-containing protein n=1 Tax=Tenacibaculum sp. M341 TaxID=2530339 RepID=UPI0010477B5F|nr:SH3 domain-containing protein [Tenacibaculum sp. M341]TCI93786.1 SH3 domain-containing protein [Tenacibaculum sp. M341]